MPVHLYAGVCDMDRLTALARAHGLAIVEDCAEALGAAWGGRHVGQFSDAAAFSFFGNKTVTTGEGGMVTARDPDMYRRLSLARGQGMDPDHRYWHVVMGFNYRNDQPGGRHRAGPDRAPAGHPVAKAAGRAPLSRTPGRRAGDLPVLPPQAESADWLVTLLVPPGVDRDRVMRDMAEAKVETRPVFYCAHTMPHHLRPDLDLPVSQDIAARGISLPSYPDLTDADIDRVCETLLGAIRSQA